MQAPARTVLPLRQRPIDLFFVCAFACFVTTSVIFDSLNALNIRIAPDATNPIARVMWDLYAKDTDLLLPANPFWVQLELWISTFVFAPFYVAAIVALVRGRNWIHIPAIAYASAMVYSLVLYLGAQFSEPYLSPAPAKILAMNLPYAIIAVLFAYRMRSSRPFSE